MSQQPSQRFCLRWNNHQSNLLSVFDQLLQDESFVDVTLAVEGQFLRAHKMVLSACSPYFQTLFVGHPDKHPIVILKDVPFADMRSLLDFMYRGEVSVDQDRLTAFLKVAETLRIKGLTEVNEEKCDLPSIASSLLSSAQQAATSAPPPPELHRIHLAHPSNKRPSSRASSPGPGSPSYSQKRKRGRQRKLSGCSDIAVSPDRSNLLIDSETKQSNMSDSSYGHGPPDLLEVNMSDHGLNSSPSLSDDCIPCSPEQDVVLQHEDEDYCYVETVPVMKKELADPPELSNNLSSRERKASRENNIGGKSQASSHHSSERYPSDLPMLRLVPKSELIAAFAKKESSSSVSASSSPVGNNHPYHHHVRNSDNKDDCDYVLQAENDNNEIITVHGCLSPPASLSNGEVTTFFNNSNTNHSNNNNNNNNINNNNNNNNNNINHHRKYSPPAHLLSPPQSMSPANSTSNDCFTGNVVPAKPAPSRRRVRRRTSSSNDPAEQLTEMSVRGLNLFRYASIDDGVYKCMECAKSDIVKTFKNKYSFQRHAFLYHEGCQRKVFPCPVCGKEFSRPDKMKNHMKTVHDCFMPKEYVIPAPTLPYFITPS